MEPFTLDRSFKKVHIIDGFKSVIWTERYYGNSEVEIVVPSTTDMLSKLPNGIFLGVDGSDEVMILQTRDIEEQDLKLTGISLISWLTNRFVRTSALHQDRYWYLSGGTPGWVLWAIVYYMCVEGSPYLDGTINIGIPDPHRFVIPGLSLKAYDNSGDAISIGVPYGPVYEAMAEIAKTYSIGMQITLESVTDTSYSLGFRSYKGLDRTSAQTVNPIVRFSPQMDSLSSIKELDSIAALKTLAYSFAPGLNPAEGDPDLRTIPGTSTLGGTRTGFDLRAELVFADDVTTDMVGGSSDNLINVLNGRANNALGEHKEVIAVDGEIVPTNQFQYGKHYSLGDIIEVQGNSGAVQRSRVTEYIRTQSASGEKSYPTVEAIT
jgi:Siphovirus ReqiPepy6 Gp37-like protein